MYKSEQTGDPALCVKTETLNCVKVSKQVIWNYVLKQELVCQSQNIKTHLDKCVKVTK